MPVRFLIRIALATEAGRPAIRLPIEGEDAQGRYRLGTIRVLTAGKSPR